MRTHGDIASGHGRLRSTWRIWKRLVPSELRWHGNCRSHHLSIIVDQPFVDLGVSSACPSFSLHSSHPLFSQPSGMNSVGLSSRSFVCRTRQSHLRQLTLPGAQSKTGTRDRRSHWAVTLHWAEKVFRRVTGVCILKSVPIGAHHSSPPHLSVLARGILKNYNTIEEFKNADKRALFNKLSDEVCAACRLHCEPAWIRAHS